MLLIELFRKHLASRRTFKEYECDICGIRFESKRKRTDCKNCEEQMIAESRVW